MSGAAASRLRLQGTMPDVEFTIHADSASGAGLNEDVIEKRARRATGEDARPGCRHHHCGSDSRSSPLSTSISQCQGWPRPITRPTPAHARTRRTNTSGSRTSNQRCTSHTHCCETSAAFQNDRSELGPSRPSDQVAALIARKRRPAPLRVRTPCEHTGVQTCPFLSIPPPRPHTKTGDLQVV